MSLYKTDIAAYRRNYMSTWRANNPKKVKAHNKTYYVNIKADPVKYRHYRQTHIDSEKRQKTRLFRILGNKCAHCSYDTHPEILQVHHIHNDRVYSGWKEISGLFEDDIRTRFILICHNCHILVHYKEDKRRRVFAHSK